VEFIARHADVPHAADSLRKAPPRGTLILLDDPTFPAARAAQILRSFAGEHPLLHSYFLKEARLEVVESYLDAYGQETMVELEVAHPLVRVKAVLALSALAYHLPAHIRDKLTGRSFDLPEVALINRHTIPTPYLTWKLKAKLLVLEILDHVDRLVASVPESFPFKEIRDEHLRHNLEYFPRFERPAGNIGTAVETMEKLLPLREITEDQVQRVQGTRYCSKPFGDAAEYRQQDVFRENGLDSYRPLPPLEIPEKMRELVEWVNSPRAQALHPFIRAVLFYGRYDQIHPFEDQTKQVGRFFMAKLLLQGQNELRYPPIIAGADLDRPPLILVPVDAIEMIIRTPGERTSHELIQEKRMTELTLQLLYLYANKLDLFFGRDADRISNPHMREIDRLLHSGTNELFRL
jgi:hypothetical protein